MNGFRQSSLVPAGFAIDGVDTSGSAMVMAVHATSTAARCPACGAPSSRIHSRYRRRLTDLPVGGRVMKLKVMARRFNCDAVLCGRRIFTERFSELAPWARRTTRLDTIVRHLGLALGGRPAASFAARLMMPVSNDTLLRAVRRRGKPRMVPPSVVGIDDWAWRRNCRYGTIVCDLERRWTIALLPDREPATAQAWLAEQKQIGIVARDRLAMWPMEGLNGRRLAPELAACGLSHSLHRVLATLDLPSQGQGVINLWKREGNSPHIMPFVASWRSARRVLCLLSRACRACLPSERPVS